MPSANNIPTILIHISQILLQEILIKIIIKLQNNSMVYKECIINSNNITNLIILLQVMEVIILLDMLCINSMINNNSNRHHLNINSNNNIRVNTDSSRVLVVGTHNLLEEAAISRRVIKVIKTSDNPKCLSSRLGTNTNTETSSTPNNMWM